MRGEPAEPKPEPDAKPEAVVKPEPKPEPVVEPMKAEPKTVKPKPIVTQQQQQQPDTGEDGYLTLRTEPWADVYLGAEKLGTTPLIRAPVPSGKRTLLLKNEKVGFSRKLNLTIEPGKELKQAVVVEQGAIKVDGPAGIEVWLDGARLGTTPLAAFDVVEGRHDVRLGAMSKPVKVRAGQTETVSP